MGMLVHLMFNVRLHGCQHWSTMAMEHRKDLLVMIPFHGQKEICFVVGVLFCDKAQVLFWYVCDNCQPMTPFNISYDETVKSINDMLG